MKDIFSIIIDKSVESNDGSARVLNIDDVFTGLEEQGYCHYLFGGYQHVFTKKPLSEDECVGLEIAANEAAEEMVKNYTKEVDKRIIEYMEKNGSIKQQPLEFKELRYCPESALQLLYDYRFIETDQFGQRIDDEPYDSYRKRYRCLCVDGVIYCVNTDHRYLTIKKMLENGDGMSALRRYFDAIVNGAIVIKNRFGTVS